MRFGLGGCDLHFVPHKTFLRNKRPLKKHSVQLKTFNRYKRRLKIISIEYAVEVVAFVLEDDGGETLDGFGRVA